MIDLYTAPTPNGWKAAMALEELELTYSVHSIDLAAGEQHAPDFGRIPVIVDRCDRCRKAACWTKKAWSKLHQV